MARGLRLQRSEVVNVDYVYLGAFRLRVDVVDAHDMDDRIFLWRRGPVDPYTGEPTDNFFTLCSAVDMSEFPGDAPDANKAYPFFRRNWVELDFRAVSQAEEAWRLFQERANVLIESLNILERLVVTQTVQCGAEGPGGSDS